MDPTLSRLKARDIPPVPEEVMDSFRSHRATLISFEEISKAITDPRMRTENGVAEFRDGSFMVSVSCRMRGVTREMLEWWLWWFPQDAERFRTWLPEANFEVTYSEDDSDYFSAKELPPFRPVTLYPCQAIGEISFPFRMDLVMPEEFGFTPEDIEAAGDPFLVCGRMMSRRGKSVYADVLYSAYPTDYGSLLNVRIWVGRLNGNMLQRLLIHNERRTIDLAGTCYHQYSCLDGILPELYRENHR